MHTDGLLDFPLPPIRTTTDYPNVNRIGLAVQSQQHVTPIKYEDLEHIVGPGFEEELERYYDQHKHELEESTRRTSKPPIKEYDPNEDPWSIYDKPSIILQTTAQSNTSTQTQFGDRFSMFDSDVHGNPTVVTFLTKSHAHQPNTNLVSSNTLKVNSQFETVSTAKPIHTTNSATKKRVKPKLYKLVQVPIVQTSTSTSTSLFGLSSIVNFFRKIQNSFVSNSSRSIQDKIKMLESFRDDLMKNISKL